MLAQPVDRRCELAKQSSRSVINHDQVRIEPLDGRQRERRAEADGAVMRTGVSLCRRQ